MFQKVLLILGEVGDPAALQQVDGSLTIRRHDKAFPPTSWPVLAARFKALLHLVPGPNVLSLEFVGASTGNIPHT